MRAAIWTNYGPPEVLQVREVPKPAPKESEILIKIYASTVTAGDCEMRSLKMPLFLGTPTRLYIGLRKPTRIKILGQELAGQIEAVGSAVTRYKVGDQVFGTPGFSLGGYAEYKVMPANPEDGVLAHKPANLSYAEAAAAVVGGLEAQHFLGQANLQPGQKVLVNGAGGSIGTIGVQLAKLAGAEVTAVDHGVKLDMLRAIGADLVIDYTQEDFTQNGQTYDVIFDVIGKAPFDGSLKALNPQGKFLIANPNLTKMVRAPLSSSRSGKQVVMGTASYQPQDLKYLADLLEAGKLTVVIDRTFPLEGAAEAHRYVETGQKKGNVIIAVQPEESP